MTPLPGNTLQSLPIDCQAIIANELANVPSGALAFVPSIRSWAATNVHFHQMLSEAGWLSRESVCDYKLGRVLDFSCPTTRLLNVATRYADGLTLSSFKAAVEATALTRYGPGGPILAGMLVNRAGDHLKPDVTSALRHWARQSPNFHPGELRLQDPASEPETNLALAEFFEDVLEQRPRSEDEACVASRCCFLIDDVYAMLDTWPTELRVRAFIRMAIRVPGMAISVSEPERLACMEVLFDLASLIPVQWEPALTTFRTGVNDLPFQIYLIADSPHYSPMTRATICCRVLQMVGSFLDSVPDPASGQLNTMPAAIRRHWTSVMNGCPPVAINFIKRLLLAVHTCLGFPRVKASYAKELAGRGFIHPSEIPTGKDLPGPDKQFLRWCQSMVSEPSFEFDAQSAASVVALTRRDAKS